ncbi:conserved hypothetical protein [uncultured delta proteobacterium]|uniref:Nudix hydrolase domain-containing protein n=1 Tax=uncultured delta proteobacterium TaxID=34034 RepID=A0A212KFC4_9DELT|nr:conserved hypothetical protein [uncultured delta proteobacterium]
MQLKLTTPLPGRAAQSEMAPLYRQPALLKDIPPDALESAVLALLFPANEGKSREELLDWSVLLLRRNSYPGAHSGQISFPGGKREAGDADLWATACRETCEEVGIGAACLNRVGALTKTYIPASNFVIYPYVAVARPEARVCLAPREVVEYRLVPIRTLDPGKAVTLDFTYECGTKPAPAWLYEGFTIWGATAMMLAEFYRVIDRGLLVRN